jgi:hypothetical protein
MQNSSVCAANRQQFFIKKAPSIIVPNIMIAILDRTSVLQPSPGADEAKAEVKTDSESAQELLAKLVGTHDESELCKLFLEISPLDSAYQPSTANGDDVLMDAAKSYRLSREKLQKAVAEEFAAKQDKETRVKPRTQSKTASVFWNF